MKERPIPFSAPMVRAILDGTKRQTRRVVKPQPLMVTDKTLAPWVGPPGALKLGLEALGRGCPYGQPGDRLWVREAFRLVRTVPGGADGDKIAPSKYLDSTRRFEADGAVSYPDAGMRVFGKLRPGMFMPRWASRITLEVTGVRVERLQDISEADAMAEGCTRNHNNYYWGGPHKAGGLKQMANAKQAYQDLWESINSPGSWDANPWVWVVEFKRLEGGAA
jgi:hypothetical protein